MNAQGFEGERLALGFAHLMEELWAADSEQSTLLSVVKAAAASVPGAVAAGVSMRRARGRIDTAAATARFVTEVDKAQYELREGPCVASVDDSLVNLANDLANDPHWPRFGPAAVSLGVAAMLSFRLSARSEVIGSLNLYANRPFAFTGQSRAVGGIFAAHASVAIAAARRAETLTEALKTRTEISEAVGIVMERHHLTSQEAFEVLRRISQHRNVKLREVAHRIIYTGEVPRERD
ncbi:GAF domain-containing protein [Actinopolymorpha cephalotaxi]|uniref:GAF domain-containing protein n=1 Tax=Actinopolymorpha cephalotaxi TaxID=504797 RepID=A0A1I3AR60_9ACTN|nr:GAF and ANTAR domain-containing protein [Actinopolymorpha cephalotaxi]NYH86022.1 GAF domain-containing protein [Actinopolymorpha cephalotaxi]SFH52494.1 GAF domain-containing protein [Actinopolymorpha cephalotaxi]